MTEIRPLAVELGALRGLKAQGARLRDGDSLLFSLNSELDGGRWDVRVFSTAWRIESDGDIVVGSDDEKGRLRRGVAVLDGQLLQEFEIVSPSLDTTFIFASCRLRIFPVTARVDPRGWQQWSLRSPAGRIMDIGPGASWGYRESGVDGAHSR